MDKLFGVQRPQFLSTAIHSIWLTLAIDAVMMAVSYDGTPANASSLSFNGAMLLLYAFVTVKISAGRNWARRSYAFFIAMEFALVAAFGLSDASELEGWVTYLTLPLELGFCAGYLVPRPMSGSRQWQGNRSIRFQSILSGWLTPVLMSHQLILATEWKTRVGNDGLRTGSP